MSRPCEAHLGDGVFWKNAMHPSRSMVVGLTPAKLRHAKRNAAVGNEVEVLMSDGVTCVLRPPRGTTLADLQPTISNFDRPLI